MRRDVQLWLIPLIVVVIYPTLIASCARAITDYHQFGNPLLAAYAWLAMLLAGSVPALAARALILMRHENDVPARALLYLMFAVSPLFILVYSLAQIVGLAKDYAVFSAVWISVWVAVGVVLYNRRARATLGSHGTEVTWLRVVHGAAALCLLGGFLIAHLINHDLALWSVTLHGAVMKWLRVWYRSVWVEPVLLGLFMIMFCTGIPLLVHHSRRSADAFRIVQMATGVYVGVFLIAHLFATLSARSVGIETDWFFAAGPTSLLDGSLLDRLIPYYVFASFFMTLHVACGLRVVLLQHGVRRVVCNTAVYVLAAVGVLVTALLTMPLLGIHVKSSGQVALALLTTG